MIRSEIPADAALVDKVLKAAFPGPAEALLHELLRENGRLIVSLVDVAEGELRGVIAFSPITLEGCDAAGVGLGPVAVAPEHQRRGIGSELIRSGLEACRAARQDYVVVLGEPGYYSRFGFAPAAAQGLENEYGAGDAFQVLELRPGCLQHAAGLVRYADEFREL